ncbi:substrate-binding domain-containing protein [Microbacterium sp.]|uniref:substrate-binding domain-containing protein n=1 Tax=Microbacterium sp. TaxID=51671 RepID=UPI00260E554E|nr:substrate-binding domain-containing protein [Microbacterium sp.]
MRTRALVALVVMAGFGLAGCTATSTPLPSPTLTPLEGTASGSVGVVLPASGELRWTMAGDALESLLNEAGVTVTVDYADAAEQDDRIEELIAADVDVLIVTAADEQGLVDALATAEADGIDVIALDRLPINATGIDFFIAPDRYGFGYEAAVAATSALGLSDEQGNPTGVVVDDPFRIEVFGADIDDWDYWFFYNSSVRDSLAAYLESGDLVVGSGQIEGEDVDTTDSSSEAAQARMTSILESSYADGEKLSAVVTASAEIADGVRAALADSGRSDIIVTTVGDDPETIRSLGNGLEATVFSDIRVVARTAAETAVAELNGTETALSRTEDYFTNTGSVTTRLVWPEIVAEQSRQAKIIDTWYYTADQLG